MPSLAYPITIFYDGACAMCVRQMEKFRRKDQTKRLIFIDSARPDFDVEKYDLRRADLQKYIYASDAGGRVVRGIEAFSWMWQATGLRLLPWLLSVPLIKPIAKIIYRIISRLRYQVAGQNQHVCDLHCAKEI